MSALTDLFTAMANKIRSKTGTATTYTPSEMASDGIDDVYDAGVASATTSIIPSNVSPVAMSANTGYKPTASGYAIKSYIDLIPSNSSPVTLRGGNLYRTDPSSVLTKGYAIESYGIATPSNSSPVTLSSGSIYKMGGAGKAVESVTSKTPSDSSPASVTANSIIQPTAAGYLVENVPINLLAPDTFWQGNLSGNGSQSVTVTKKPRNVIYSYGQYGANNGYSGIFVFDAQNNTGVFYRYSSSGYVNVSYADVSSWLTSVTSTSVTVKNNTNSTVRGQILIYY